MITRKNFQDISICNAPSQMILKIFEFFFGRCRSPTYKYVVQGSAIELGRAPKRKLKPILEKAVEKYVGTRKNGFKIWQVVQTTRFSSFSFLLKLMIFHRLTPFYS